MVSLLVFGLHISLKSTPDLVLAFYVWHIRWLSSWYSQIRIKKVRWVNISTVVILVLKIFYYHVIPTCPSRVVTHILASFLVFHVAWHSRSMSLSKGYFDILYILNILIFCTWWIAVFFSIGKSCLCQGEADLCHLCWLLDFNRELAGSS